MVKKNDTDCVTKAVNKILEGANVKDTISNVSLTERSMFTKERMIEVVLPNEEPFFIILSVPGNMKNPKGYIQNWVRTHLPSNADWDYSESRKVNGRKISESSEEKYAFMNDIIDKIVSMDADDFVLNYVDTSDKEKLVNYVETRFLPFEMDGKEMELSLNDGRLEYDGTSMGGNTDLYFKVRNIEQAVKDIVGKNYLWKDLYQ